MPNDRIEQGIGAILAGAINPPDERDETTEPEPAPEPKPPTRTWRSPHRPKG